MKNQSDFPEKEYRLRIRNVQNLIAEKDLEALFMTQAEHVYYITGTRTSLIWTTKDRPFVVIVKEDGSTILITAETMKVVAQETAWFDEIMTYPKGDAAISTILNAFKLHGLENASIGAELSYGFRIGLSVEAFDLLRKELKGKFVDASEIFWKMRMVKTQLEIDRIRKAVEITSHAMERGFESFSEGMTEKELARNVISAMIDEGADSFSHMILHSGERFGYPDPKKKLLGTRPHNNKINKGDYIDLDCGARYNYYAADLDREARVGMQPSPDMRDLYEVYKSCSKEGIKAMKPGAKAEDIYKAVKNVIDESGLKLDFRSERFGHGLGLDLHEPPDLGKGVKTILEPGMILAMEPWGIYDIKGHEFNCEDNVLITKSGNEVLSTLHRDLRIL